MATINTEQLWKQVQSYVDKRRLEAIESGDKATVKIMDRLEASAKKKINEIEILYRSFQSID